ncbi:MAG: sigma-70 family RNA polymerase sigma factor [Clostridiales bacterium]|nr:sigma-70 family RNA polymerase sigma factor [Clostridiales bacterium]
MSYFGEDINQYLIAFKNGDKSQFDTFFNKYHDYFLSWAVYYLVNKDNREDVISETYFKICKYIYSFNSKEDGYNWIIRIIQNTARTINKKELRCKTVDIDSIYLTEGHDPYSEVDIKIDLDRLFKNKDFTNYVIAVLSFRKGRTQEEIADMLGISKSAVCQRMSKIREVVENYSKKN